MKKYDSSKILKGKIIEHKKELNRLYERVRILERFIKDLERQIKYKE